MWRLSRLRQSMQSYPFCLFSIYLCRKLFEKEQKCNIDHLYLFQKELESHWYSLFFSSFCVIICACKSYSTGSCTKPCNWSEKRKGTYSQFCFMLRNVNTNLRVLCAVKLILWNCRRDGLLTLHPLTNLLFVSWQLACSFLASAT
jgi:hypothetical protein